jgi:hypothetical protein
MAFGNVTMLRFHVNKKADLRVEAGQGSAMSPRIEHKRGQHGAGRESVIVQVGRRLAANDFLGVPLDAVDQLLYLVAGFFSGKDFIAPRAFEGGYVFKNKGKIFFTDTKGSFAVNQRAAAAAFHYEHPAIEWFPTESPVCSGILSLCQDIIC